MDDGTLGRTKQELLLGYDNNKTNEIVKLGREKALAKITERVLKEHGKDIINLCPKCGKLARTPSAKQCRHCLYDWH